MKLKTVKLELVRDVGFSDETRRDLGIPLDEICELSVYQDVTPQNNNSIAQAVSWVLEELLLERNPTEPKPNLRLRR